MLQSRIEVGSRVRFDEEVYVVERFQGPDIQLRSRSGQVSTVSFHTLLGAPDFHVYGDEDDGPPVPAVIPDWNNVPSPARARAERRAKDLNEAWTGYQSGHRELPEPGEPRPEYDPSAATLSERVGAKARALRTAMRTLLRQHTAYMRFGVWGLVDKRNVRLRAPLGRVQPEIIAAVDAVLRERTNDSNLSEQQYRRAVWKRVRRLPGAAQPVSQSTFNRVFRELTKGRATRGSAERRRSVAERPDTPYRHLYVTRPGECIVVDLWESDVYAVDPLTFEWTNIAITIAQDIYTRSIVAWRFGPRFPKDVDAAFLLADIVRPKVMRPHWPATARWRYHGVPESIVVPLGNGEPVAGIPIVVPDTVVADHAKIFTSHRFRDACIRLKCNLQPTRVYTPTDKAHTERVFRTFRESLLEYMPGYKGPRQYARGEDIEAGAFYFIDEIEEYFAEWVAAYYQLTPHSSLHLPTTPHLSMSPNDMYDEGLTRAGFLTIPRDPTIYYDLLRPKHRTIQSYGVEIDGLYYDGETLDPYRNRTSPYGGLDKNKGKWLIRYDPRDVSHVYFQDPRTLVWSALAWTDAVPGSRPFTAATLAYAKRRLQRDAGDRPPQQGLNEALNAILDRIDGDMVGHRERAQLGATAFDAARAVRDRKALGALPAVAEPATGDNDPDPDLPEDTPEPMEVAHDDDWAPWDPSSTEEDD